jgi:hypothetical protein
MIDNMAAEPQSLGWYISQTTEPSRMGPVASWSGTIGYPRLLEEFHHKVMPMLENIKSSEVTASWDAVSTLYVVLYFTAYIGSYTTVGISINMLRNCIICKPS